MYFYCFIDKKINYINEFLNNSNIIIKDNINLNEIDNFDECDIIFLVNTDENINPNIKKKILNIPLIKINLSSDININYFISEKIFIYYQVKFRYGKYYDLIKKEKKIYLENKNNENKNHFLNNNLLFVYNDVFSNHVIDHRINDFQQLFMNYLNTNNNTKYIINLYLDDNVSNSDVPCITHNRDYNSTNYILFPTNHYFYLSNYILDTTPFVNKYDKIIWRGSTTGLGDKYRFHFIEKTFELDKNIDIGFSNYCQLGSHLPKEIQDKYYKESISLEELYKYKFILCLEGNDWSSSFIWALNSFVCPLHTFPFTKENILFGNGLKEWVHFIPIKPDGSDLLKKYQWCLNNIKICEEIAMNGYNYMKYYRNDKIMNKIVKTMMNMYPFILES